MLYEFLVLHALKMKLAARKDAWSNEFETTDAASPEQITKWLWNNWFFFVDGNHTRVALKRLRDKGFVARDANGLFFITSLGEKYYEENKDRIFNSPLTHTEKCVFDFLCRQAVEWGQVYRFKVKEVAEILNMPYKKCLSTCLSLHCKNKVALFKIRGEYWVRLSFQEFERIRKETMVEGEPVYTTS
jgi:hypothetical protein